MKNSSDINKDILEATSVLKAGGLILYPTDTIWGIGCDARNEAAVSRIYALKKRSDTKSMLILLDKDYRVQHYLKDIPDIVWELLEVSDSPLTLVCQGAKNLASNLIAPDGSIGFRVSNEQFSQRLIQRFGGAIVSTSANISGEKTPSLFSEVKPEIKNGVDYIVRYRQEETTPGKPSSILRIGPRGEVEILRK